MARSVLNVFTYHRVLPAPSEDGVSAATFRWQLAHLKRHYEILGHDGVLAFLRGELVPERPAAALTFDDGWADSWQVATPILRELDVPAILALSTSLVHDGPLRAQEPSAETSVSCDQAFRSALYEGDRRAFLSARELRAMSDSGRWSIQAHGHLHACGFHSLVPVGALYPAHDHWSLRHALGGEEPFPGVPCPRLASDLAVPRQAMAPGLLAALRGAADGHAGIVASWDAPLREVEPVAAFEARLEADLRRCCAAIVELTGRSPDMFFWPWGHYSRPALGVARDAVGFLHTFSTRKGVIETGLHQAVLPRISIAESRRKFVRNAFVFRHRELAWLRCWAADRNSRCELAVP